MIHFNDSEALFKISTKATQQEETFNYGFGSLFTPAYSIFFNVVMDVVWTRSKSVDVFHESRNYQTCNNYLTHWLTLLVQSMMDNRVLIYSAYLSATTYGWTNFRVYPRINASLVSSTVLLPLQYTHIGI